MELTDWPNNRIFSRLATIFETIKFFLNGGELSLNSLMSMQPFCYLLLGGWVIWHWFATQELIWSNPSDGWSFCHWIELMETPLAGYLYTKRWISFVAKSYCNYMPIFQCHLWLPCVIFLQMEVNVYILLQNKTKLMCFSVCPHSGSLVSDWVIT